MNKIDRIIRESIDRFILREINEGIDDAFREFTAKVKDANGNWVTVSAKTKAGLRRKVAEVQGKETQKREYNRRPAPTSVAEVCLTYEMPNSRKAKWISKLLRNEWWSTDLKKILTFNKRSSTDFGQEDRDKLDNAIRKKVSINDTPNPASPVKNETVNSLQKVFSWYSTVNDLTTKVEEWGAQGDYNSIKTELAKMPQALDELSTWVGHLYNDINDNKDKINPNTQRVGNIRTGYKRKTGGQAIKGTDQLFGNKNNLIKIQTKLAECAEMIRECFGDFYGEGKNDDGPIDMRSEPVSGIKTIRR